MINGQASPDDRNRIALYVQEIEKDHKPGPDGNLVEVHKIYFGKRGEPNYQQIYEVKRLQKENPMLWDYVRSLYENWLKNETIEREGLALESWPAITKGQIKACKGLGLHTVEDIALATDSIRQRLGLGASDLMDKAKAFVANKADSAVANKVAALEAQLAQMAQDLAEARETNDRLAAEAGRRVRRPRQPDPVDEQEAA